MNYIIYYFIIINIISGAFFIFDKVISAYKHKRRISENSLHFLELVGGVFVIFPLMHMIRHKNRKVKYNFITGIILLGWIALLYFLFYYLELNIDFRF